MYVYNIYLPMRSTNPAPTSSSSCPPNKPPKSPCSAGASPRTGALGLMCRLRFSWPALLGNVGNISALFGFGSSLKYGWRSTSSAVMRCDGSSARSRERSSTPDEVRRGKRARRWDPMLRCVSAMLRKGREKAIRQSVSWEIEGLRIGELPEAGPVFFRRYPTELEYL